MSAASRKDRPRRPADQDGVSPRARRKQVIVAIIIGLIVGLVIGYFTQFWLWVPAGIATGLASGYLIRPPE